MSEQNTSNAPEGSPNAPETPEAKPEQKPGSLEIKIKDQNENETFFRIKKHTKLGKVFEAYCDRQSLTRNTVRFLFEGTRVQENDTPEGLDIEDGDMIQAVLEQVGGDGTADPVTPGAAPAEDEKPQEKVGGLSIKVKDQNENETFFKIKTHTNLGKVFDAYCERQSLARNTVRFLFEGGRIQDTDTPESLEMQDDDMVQAMLEQVGGAVDDGAGVAEEKPEQKPQGGEHINIKVIDQSSQEICFKIKRSTQLKKVMNAYCQRQGLDMKAVRFLFDGERLQEDDTPTSREMEEDDVIEVFLEQLGGATDQEVEGSGEPKPEPQKISIKVKDSRGDEVEFKCKSTTVLKKLMDAFCQQRGRKPDTLRFFTPDGKRINNTDTPESLNLEDGDLLDVHEEQQGGRD
ncbi:hypothetical protein IFR05_001657 [Cadophora sp. M221]|nr:hypothetical protein IFR05_001657 [Cadophora sp. M221]